MKPEIMTVSGTYFNFLEPEKSVYTINDISHALSHVNRYTGHTKRAYTVGQHCVVGSYMIDPEFAYEFLMHDAAESMLGDVSTPLKCLLPDYKVIEARVEIAMAAKFNLSYPMLPQVKQTDLRMLATEVAQLMPEAARDWEVLKEVEPYNVTLEPWTPYMANKRFLQRYYQLTKGK